MRGRRRTRIVARVDDDTAVVSVTWFNQPWLADRLKPGTEVRLRGKLGRYGFEPRSYDIGDEARATADFAPVYPAAEEIAAATVRRVVDAALPLAVHVPDPLPAELREREGLALKRDALAAVHRPRDLGEAETGPAAARLRGAARPPDRHRAARRPSESGRSRRRSASRAT